MVRIAPVRLSFNPKTLWFDAGEHDLHVDDAVVVMTARGLEFGHVSDAVFEMSYEDTRKLKSPLKPVKRLATEEDVEKSKELDALSMEALPVFRRLADEFIPDMSPVAVEYLFEGDKAVFYFESEERVDFRDLVRKLAAELHVRVDMKQIGVRDGARMVGGLGHCGQELCCRRLGGEFNPVSIRMAKEQDLSLNPQKISGVCGRLMCCLRYEYDAYKDFHSRAPKKNARIQTPDGEGKVVDLDVPREVVSIKVGDEKPVKVPLAEMDPAPEEGARPRSVGQEAWEKATTPPPTLLEAHVSLFTSELSGEDKLAEPGKVHHVHGGAEPAKPSKSRSRRRRSGSSSEGSKEQAAQATQRKPRRRSTTVKSDGSTQTAQNQQESGGKAAAASRPQGEGTSQKRSSRRRRSRSASKQNQVATEQQQKGTKVGRNSSALRAGRPQEHAASEPAAKKEGGGQRRRRRSHRTGSGGEGNTGETG